MNGDEEKVENILPPSSPEASPNVELMNTLKELNGGGRGVVDVIVADAVNRLPEMVVIPVVVEDELARKYTEDSTGVVVVTDQGVFLDTYLVFNVHIGQARIDKTSLELGNPLRDRAKTPPWEMLWNYILHEGRDLSDSDIRTARNVYQNMNNSFQAVNPDLLKEVVRRAKEDASRRPSIRQSTQQYSPQDYLKALR